MKTLKTLFLSFLTFILFSYSSSSQEVLPDSLLALTESNQLNEKASGWQKAIQFFFEAEDSIQYREALLSFNKLPLEDLSETDKIKIVKAHSGFLQNSYQYVVAKRFLLKFVEDAKKKNNRESKAIFHASVVPSYFYSFQYDSCELHIDSAIALYSKLDIIKEIGDLTIRKSGVNYAKGDYEKAIAFAYKAIEIFKETGNNEKLALAYLQLGNIFYFLEDYNESMQYYKLSLAGFRFSKDDEGVYRVISNIGLVNLELKNYRECISQQLEANKYFEANDKELEKGNAYRFLSDAYFGIEKYDSSKYYNQLSSKSNKKSKYYVGLAEGFLMNSKILIKENNLQEALVAAKKSYAIADSVQQFESIKDAAEQLAILYDALGQIDSSYRYLKLQSSLQDSLDLDPEVLKEYAMKHQFQVEEAEFELLLATEKAKIQEELNARKQKQLVVAIIVAICSLLLLVLAIIMLYRNKILSKQLTEKQNQITSELEIKESLLNEIHHRVKNNLQVISSMLSLQTQYISDVRVHKVIDDCKTRINSMSLIHESLYKKTDGIEAPFSEYIQKLVPQLIEVYKVDKSKVKANMNLEEIHLSLDESIPCGLLINEIVSNALKHAFPKGENGQIDINLSKKDGIIQLRIADNGIGFSDHTDITKEESFGFLLIETMVKQLEAKMECVNENGVKYDIRWKSIS